MTRKPAEETQGHKHKGVGMADNSQATFHEMSLSCHAFNAAHIFIRKGQSQVTFILMVTIKTWLTL